MDHSASTISDPLYKPTHDFIQNPYPVLAELRTSAPVFWSEKGKYWLVSNFADAHSILGDLHFEKGPPRWRQQNLLAKLLQGGPMASYSTTSMLNANPPDHTRLRSLVNKAFTPSMINQMRTHIEELATELLDAVQDKNQMDVIADFAYPLPAIVIAEMLGVPAGDRDKFKVWSHAITAVLDPAGPGLIDLAKVMHAYRELNNYLIPLVEDRRKQRQNDLISALVDAEEGGTHLTQAELLANTVLLLIAGHETTANLIGNGTYALLRNRDQLDLLTADLNLLPGAVQEFLRYDSPVQMVRRIADEDTELSGKKILSGQNVIVLLGAANHDPAIFEDAEKLDIRRSKNRHISFGHGIHHCLGSSLAALEAEIAMRQLLKRMPNIKLGSQEPQYKQPFSLRGVKELLVTF
jgi:cytochrome P450